MKEKTKRIILGIVIGGVISSGIGVSALLSSEVKYQKHNQETVKDALDDLHAKVNALASKNIVYADGEIVYYNPLLDQGCTESDYNSSTNSATGYVGNATNDTTKAGSCMRWFAYQDSNNSDTVHLLLDHNTTATKQWWTSKVYKTFYESQLYTTDLPNLINNSKWNVELEVNPSGNVTQTDGATVLTLLDANDVADIIHYSTIRKGTNWDSTNTNNYFYFETGTTGTGTSYNQTTYKSRFWWLYDRTYNCTSYGCKTADSNLYGYWTKTNAGSGSTVWLVYFIGNLDCYDASNASSGVRPVVIVQKSKI